MRMNANLHWGEDILIYSHKYNNPCSLSICFHLFYCHQLKPTVYKPIQYTNKRTGNHITGKLVVINEPLDKSLQKIRLIVHRATVLQEPSSSQASYEVDERANREQPGNCKLPLSDLKRPQTTKTWSHELLKSQLTYAIARETTVLLRKIRSL